MHRIMFFIVQLFRETFSDSSFIDCSRWWIWQAIFPVCLNFCVELILMLRCAYITLKSLPIADSSLVRALYHDRKSIRIALYISWASEQLTTAIAAVYSLRLGLENLAGCTLIPGPLIALPYW